MGIGIGIVLVVVGLILLTGAVDLPAAINDHIDSHLIGLICLIAGAVALALAVFTMTRGTRTTVEERHIQQ